MSAKSDPFAGWRGRQPSEALRKLENSRFLARTNLAMCRWLKYMSCIKRPPQALGMSCHGQCRSPFHNLPGINSGFAGARMALKRSRNKHRGNTKRGCARILKILPGKDGFLNERSTFSLHWPANEKGDPLSDLMQT